MPGDSAVIVGVGMMTAVGLTAPETAASVRSATARFSESVFRDKELRPFVLAEVPADGLPPAPDDDTGFWGVLTARERRMVRLAEMPLRECLAPLGGRPVRPGMCLALPEPRSATPSDGARFAKALATRVPNAFDPLASDASHLGRAGGLIAIGQAVATIVSGQADFMIAGGIDTYRDPYVLGTLDDEQRVKSDDNWDGFIPGEGACFLLLAAAGAASTHGLSPLSHLSSVAVAFEPGHLYSAEPYRGEGLAGALQQLIAAGSAPSPLLEVYSSMTGESHWAKEWGVAFLRNKAAFDANHGMHHPANCFGDTGAASGPLLAGLATIGIKRGYARSPALVYASSDAGPRAAIVVSS